MLPALGVGLLAEGIYYFEFKTKELPTNGVGLALLFVVVAGVWVGILPMTRRRPISPPIFAVTVMLSVGVALNFFGVSMWAWGKSEDDLIRADADAVREGLVLREITSSNAKIAYIAAGAMPYFAGRQAVDLLGKSDAVIAKSKPAAAFYPGHSKWNYGYSIGQLKPDLITALWGATHADKKNINDWGYAASEHGYYLKNSTNINRALLETPAP